MKIREIMNTLYVSKMIKITVLIMCGLHITKGYAKISDMKNDITKEAKSVLHDEVKKLRQEARKAIHAAAQKGITASKKKAKKFASSLFSKFKSKLAGALRGKNNETNPDQINMKMEQPVEKPASKQNDMAAQNMPIDNNNNPDMIADEIMPESSQADKATAASDDDTTAEPLPTAQVEEPPFLIPDDQTNDQAEEPAFLIPDDQITDPAKNGNNQNQMETTQQEEQPFLIPDDESNRASQNTSVHNVMQNADIPAQATTSTIQNEIDTLKTELKNLTDTYRANQAQKVVETMKKRTLRTFIPKFNEEEEVSQTAADDTNLDHLDAAMNKMDVYMNKKKALKEQIKNKEQELLELQ